LANNADGYRIMDSFGSTKNSTEIIFRKFLKFIFEDISNTISLCWYCFNFKRVWTHW